MLNRTQLVTTCKRLERSVQESDFVFFDIQFDEADDTLRIILNQRPGRGSMEADPTTKKTIDARLFWDVLRELNKLGVSNPAIQQREHVPGRPESRGFVRPADSSPFSGR
jgi:hypothetical protein